MNSAAVIFGVLFVAAVIAAVLGWTFRTSPANPPAAKLVLSWSSSGKSISFATVSALDVSSSVPTIVQLPDAPPTAKRNAIYEIILPEPGLLTSGASLRLSNSGSKHYVAYIGPRDMLANAGTFYVVAEMGEGVEELRATVIETEQGRKWSLTGPIGTTDAPLQLSSSGVAGSLGDFMNNVLGGVAQAIGGDLFNLVLGLLGVNPQTVGNMDPNVLLSDIQTIVQSVITQEQVQTMQVAYNGLFTSMYEYVQSNKYIAGKTNQEYAAPGADPSILSTSNRTVGGDNYLLQHILPFITQNGNQYSLIDQVEFLCQGADSDGKPNPSYTLGNNFLFLGWILTLYIVACQEAAAIDPANKDVSGNFYSPWCSQYIGEAYLAGNSIIVLGVKTCFRMWQQAAQGYVAGLTQSNGSCIVPGLGEPAGYQYVQDSNTLNAGAPVPAIFTKYQSSTAALHETACTLCNNVPANATAAWTISKCGAPPSTQATEREMDLSLYFGDMSAVLEGMLSVVGLVYNPITDSFQSAATPTRPSWWPDITIPLPIGTPFGLQNGMVNEEISKFYCTSGFTVQESAEGPTPVPETGAYGVDSTDQACPTTQDTVLIQAYAGNQPLQQHFDTSSLQAPANFAQLGCAVGQNALMTCLDPQLGSIGKLDAPDASSRVMFCTEITVSNSSPPLSIGLDPMDAACT